MALFSRLLSPLSFFAAAPAFAQDAVKHMAEPWQLGFQDAASPVMEQLTWLHDHFLMYIITAVAVLVLAATLYICVRFRRSANPVPSKTTHNVKLEIIWTVIPVLILVAIAIPSVRTHYFMEAPQEEGITIKVTGNQWYWKYEYPDLGVPEYDSYMIKDADLKEGQVRLLSVDNPVVVPVDTVIRLQITASDVLHAFALPAFGVKKDAVPGRLNETWFRATKTGIFYGQCSELCGVDHGFMPIEVHVVSPEEFDKWVASKKPVAAATKPAKAQQ